MSIVSTLKYTFKKNGALDFCKVRELKRLDRRFKRYTVMSRSLQGARIETFAIAAKPKRTRRNG